MHEPGGLLSAMRRARFTNRLLQPASRNLPIGFHAAPPSAANVAAQHIRVGALSNPASATSAPAGIADA